MLSNLGATVDDSCFIHHDLNVDFYFFKPEVGKKLVGVVNKTTKNHVGCLVHTMFNVSIPNPKSDSDDQEESDDWKGAALQVGQEVELKVTAIELKSRLPYIKAELM